MALNISEIKKDLNVYFHLSMGGIDPTEDANVYADPDGDGAPGLAPGAEFAIDVRFAPTREGPQNSVVIIKSDDPLNPELRIPLTGNDNPGCIEVSHETLEWAGPVQMWTESPMVTVRNCGMTPC